MKARTDSRSRWLRPIAAIIGIFAGDKRGNVAAIVALSLVPLAGIMGLAAEGSNWFLSQRAQQNAADTAVVAAANQALQDFYQACSGSGCSWSSTNYVDEGKAVATKYGYTNGTGNVTVSVVNTVTCPSTVAVSGMDCFQVSITKPIALALSHLVGFNGNRGAGLEWISASAIAGPVAEPSDVCLLTLGQGHGYGVGGTSFTFHGSHGINLGGCPVGSEDNMTCTGHNLQAPWGISGNGDSDNNCGDLTLSQSGPITDPYAPLASHIPSTGCGTTSPGTTSTSAIVSTSAGSTSAPQVYDSCGTLSLSGNVTITGTQTWVIANGTLNLNGFTLTTSGSGGLTIIFTSPTLALAQTATSGGQGYITDSAGGGGINISAPAAPTVASDNYFSGVTLYQDPTPWGTGSSASTYSSVWNGNSSKTGWDLSGGVYFPNADFTFNGAVDKASNGYECFNMIVNDITSNGGNQFSVFATDLSNPLAQCGLEGTRTPYASGYRYALVG